MPDKESHDPAAYTVRIHADDTVLIHYAGPDQNVTVHNGRAFPPAALPFSEGTITTKPITGKAALTKFARARIAEHQAQRAGPTVIHEFEVKE